MYSEREGVRARGGKWRFRVGVKRRKGLSSSHAQIQYSTRSRFFQDFSLWTHIPCVIGLSLSGSARFVTLLSGVILILGLTLSLQVD